MRATEFIENNQDATLDIVMKYAENENRDHMRFMLETELSDSISAATMASGIAESSITTSPIYFSTNLPISLFAVSYTHLTLPTNREV